MTIVCKPSDDITQCLSVVQVSRIVRDHERKPILKDGQPLKVNLWSAATEAVYQSAIQLVQQDGLSNPLPIDKMYLTVTSGQGKGSEKRICLRGSNKTESWHAMEERAMAGTSYGGQRFDAILLALQHQRTFRAREAMGQAHPYALFYDMVELINSMAAGGLPLPFPEYQTLGAAGTALPPLVYGTGRDRSVWWDRDTSFTDTSSQGSSGDDEEDSVIRVYDGFSDSDDDGPAEFMADNDDHRSQGEAVDDNVHMDTQHTDATPSAPVQGGGVAAPAAPDDRPGRSRPGRLTRTSPCNLVSAQSHGETSQPEHGVRHKRSRVSPEVVPSPPLHHITDTVLHPQDVVDRHIRVWWGGDRIWFVGEVQRYDPDKGLHEVFFPSDGERLMINLGDSANIMWHHLTPMETESFKQKRSEKGEPVAWHLHPTFFKKVSCFQHVGLEHVRDFDNSHMIFGRRNAKLVASWPKT